MKRHRFAPLGLLLGTILAAVGLQALPAQAADDGPTITNVTFTGLAFGSNSQHMTGKAVVDVPNDWPFLSARMFICPGGASGPSSPNCHQDWLSPDNGNRVAQTFTVNFDGTVPDTGFRGVAPVWFQVTFRDPVSHAVVTAQSNDGAAVFFRGQSQATIAGPDSINVGDTFNLHGSVACWTNGAWRNPPANSVVTLQYRDPNTGNFTSGDTPRSSQVDDNGNWSHSMVNISSSLDWRANFGNGFTCDPSNSGTQHVTVQGGSPGPPPPPANAPGAPSLSVGGTTQSTASLNWSPPSGDTSNITGYRFGWTSDSGLPVPSWSKVYSVRAEDPFVMTNLCAGCSYTMYLEAIAGNVTGPRTEVRVTTQAPPPPPPPVVVDLPSKARHVRAHAGNHKALVTWRVPSNDGGSAVDRYQVRRHGKIYSVSADRTNLTAKHLKNGKRYTFKVRAHNAAGWSGWSSGVTVRPHG